MVTEQAVLDALRAVSDPEQQRDIVSLGLIHDLSIADSQVTFTLAFTTQSPGSKATMHSMASRVVGKIPGVSKVQVKMGGTPVKHTIAVSSGKGGVGKSTVSVNLAVALRQSGATVGIIDSDVYGPDIPLMLGSRGRPGMFENRIIPVEVHGLKMMSIGLLVNDREPLVWRGPMIHSFIQQMLKDVMWGALDYLVFDMPPGTGDAQLSLSQVIPLSGVVMVTTPQEVALLDVRKAIGMFQRLVSEYNVPLLAQVPLDPETRLAGDEGTPITLRRPDSPQAKTFRELASAVRRRVDELAVLKPLPKIG